ncbi:hypothetical protein DMENIID0001_156870 [Sergentomyia squamirostris]
MAILLIHLRRLIIILSLVYVAVDLLRRFLAIVRRRQFGSQIVRPRGSFLHIKLWVYIYTVYAYVVIFSGIEISRQRLFAILAPQNQLL